MIPICLIKTLFSGEAMLRETLLMLALIWISTPDWKAQAQMQEQDRVLQTVLRMKATLDGITDYTCEVDQAYYSDEKEAHRYRFRFFFKLGKKIRIEFLDPYSGLIIYYHGGKGDATVVPFPVLSFLKIRLSLDNPMIRTPTGQRVDQTDMDYFIQFLLKNLSGPGHGEGEYHEDQDSVHFSLTAMDYLQGQEMERYRISVSKSYWLPTRIERYTLQGRLVERSIIGNYLLNQGLGEELFGP